MQDVSSVKSTPSRAHWPATTRLALLALNFIPLAHICAIVFLTLATQGWWRLATLLATLYILPALAARTLLWIRPITGGSYSISSKEFMTWWTTAQCQMIFCRLPFLDEALRFIPGLYSLWLRLWGAKVGRLTFWAPGLRVLDRSFLKVGDDVVFGAGVRLNAHVIDDKGGEQVLHLATIYIGDRARIGGYSLLTAGSVVEPNQSLKAFSLAPPFSRWSNGRRSGGAVPR